MLNYVSCFDYSNTICTSKPFQPGLHNGFISQFLCKGFLQRKCYSHVSSRGGDVQGEEEFIRMLGWGCRMSRARSTGGSEPCPVQLTGMGTLLCGGVKVLGVRSAGMQSLLQDSSLYLLAVTGPAQVLLDESMQWHQPVSTERVGLPEGELHSQGGDLSISYVVKHLVSKANMYKKYLPLFLVVTS